MEINDINSKINSAFLGKTSSRDKKTNFYGMMSETNHKTPNGYNFLHNPGLLSTGEIDIAFVNMGHIQHIFDDDLFNTLKWKATEISLLLYNNTHVFVDFGIPNISTQNCRLGIAINMSSMYVGKFEYGREKIRFTGNHYDSKATVGFIDDDISLVPFFFPYSIVYSRHDWKGNPDNSCIVKIKRRNLWIHWGKHE
jgi:hypothetical protein